ncbi:MAG: PH-like domain-containing protein [Brachybacterium tyrofermentans]
MAGKFVGGDGILILRWRLGDQLLDTGLRLARRDDHDLLLSRKEHS